MTDTRHHADRVDERVRAIVVDDSHFMRTVVADSLEQHGIDVVATATDGVDAFNAVLNHRPDVVTMDVQMPRMDGISAVRAIMSESPTPVLMLSAHTAEGADVTFEALGAGAVDFFTKPHGDGGTMAEHSSTLAELVKSVARANLRQSVTSETAQVLVSRTASEGATLLIGASTGGPPVVEQLLRSIPLELGLRIIVVQHMPEGFTERFARRLDGVSGYEVRESSDGMLLAPGQAVVARAGSHLRVERDLGRELRLGHDFSPQRHGVRPAVDVTFETAADVIDAPLVAVVLTGMGVDGAEGAAAVAEVGGTVLAQDEETSVVYGMPKRTYELGVVDRVLPDTGIVPGILESFKGAYA